MTFNHSRIRLLNGAALWLCGAIAAMSFSGEARAQSVCTNPTPTTFTCNDPTPTPAQTASGTYTAGSTFNVVPQGVSVSNTLTPLTATMTGTINTTTPGQQAVFFNSSVGTGGLLTYTSTGTATSTGLGTVTTQLFGKSVNAVTGTNLATGNFSTGVWSRSTGGSNNVTGGTTTVLGTNSFGLSVETFDGTAVVNTGVITASGTGSNGVLSFTGLSSLAICGSNTVNVTGNITATGYGVVASGCGATTVNVNAGTTVSTPASGTTTIDNSAGTVSTTVINGTVNAFFSSNLAVNQGGTSSLLVNNGTLIGRYDGTTGADTFVNNNNLLISGTSDFRAGADLFVNNGTMTTDGATTFAGLETFGNNNILVLAPDLFSLPATTFFGASGTIRAEGGATTITSLATIVSSANLDLQDGVTDDVLTLTNAYSGSGGASLSIDASGTAADLLVTGSASGTTAVNVTTIGGLAFNQAGILVVDNGTSTADAFVLGANPGNGLFNYTLEQRGADFYLVTDPTPLVFAPLAIGNLAQDMWYQGADTYLSYAALRRGDDADRHSPVYLWAQLYASQDRYGDHETATIDSTEFEFDNRLKTHRRGAQVGIDFDVAGFTLGATGGYQHAKADGDVASFDAEGHNLGLYGLFGGPSGIYGGLLLKKDWNEVRMQNSEFINQRPDATATGIDGEVGYRFGGGSVLWDVQAGLSHVRTKIDDFSAGGLAYDFDRITSTRGRLGARAGFAAMWGAYIDAKLLHEFSGNTDLRLVDALGDHGIDTKGRGTWARIEVGAGGEKGPGPQIAGWAEFGDVKGLGVRAGFRF